MFFGVLRMPYEMAMSNELSRIQFYSRAQEAADRVEKLEAENESLRRAAPVVGDDGLLPLTDEQIEEKFKTALGRWEDGSYWAIEDADLHPFVRGLIAPYVERIGQLEREYAELREASLMISAEVSRLQIAAIAADRAARAQQQAQTSISREAFERWWAQYGDPNSYVDEAWAALIAYIDGRTAGTAPDGWKLVPVEPSAEMLKAGAESEDKDFGLIIHNVYCAMIDAAPSSMSKVKEEAK
jgi:hypothetical protein